MSTICAVAEVDLAISGMTCAACVARVEKKLSKIPGVSAVVNLATEQAHIQLAPEASAVTDADLIATVEKAGYGADLLRRVQLSGAGDKAAGGDGERQSGRAGEAEQGRGDAGKTAQNQESARRAQAVADAAKARAAARVADLWRRFWIALVLSMPVVALSMIPALQFPAWQWVAGVLALIVAAYCGWPFHKAAARAARHGTSTMDTLVSLGVIASMGWSLWALLGGGSGGLDYRMAMRAIHSMQPGAPAHVYFESAAMIVTFLLLGRWLEARSRRSAGDALHELLELGAAEAYLLRRADGTVVAATEALIPAAELQPGDVFLVKPGEKIATDGIVLAGASAVNAALLTGEAAPVEVAPGAAVTGATINTYGQLEVRATRVGEQTTLAQMGKLLTAAQTGKAPVQRLADRISSVFVQVVLGIAVLDLAVRLALGNPLEMALTSAIAVLVVACPCALGLATPTALLVGSGAASQRGILISGPEVLENAHLASVALLDKTGTLTRGEMVVTEVAPVKGEPAATGEAAVSPDELLSVAAAVEAGSEHPIAAAIVAHARERGIQAQPISDFRAIAGKGVCGVVAGEAGEMLVRAGTALWLESEGVPAAAEARAAAQRQAAQGASAVFVAAESKMLGVIGVADTLRPESAAAVTELKALGVTPIMLSGDTQSTASAVAEQLGIEAKGEVLPEGKVAAVQEYQARGEIVLMVGDGVNDAAALAAADLSIAMGAGTDVAKAAADITIVNSNPLLIPAALRISARTLRIIKENLAWAFGYNLIAIPLALAGIIAPGLAAAAMASSSVIVVTNSLRLRHVA